MGGVIIFKELRGKKEIWEAEDEHLGGIQYVRSLRKKKIIRWHSHYNLISINCSNAEVKLLEGLRDHYIQKHLRWDHL